MTFLEIEVQFKDTDKNFKIFTNLPLEGDINSITAFVNDWKKETDDYSRHSFIKYFMSKKPTLEKAYMFTSEKEVKRHFRYLTKAVV